MLDCNKRQKVVDRSAGLTVLRCVNKKSCVFGQEVNEEACSLCPVRSFTGVRPCKNLMREAPAQPSVERTAQVQDNKEIVEMLKGTPLNGVEGLKEMGDVDPGSPEYPAMSLQLWAYKEAIIKWQKAGRPTRTNEEVQKIHDTHCVGCSWYDPDKKRCKGCGCRVTTGSVAVLNKIKMKTEHCPKGEW